MSGDTAITTLRRLIDVFGGELDPAAAQAAVRLHLVDADELRIGELANKSSNGTLSAEEAAEYDGYIAAADLLSLWKSKARLFAVRRGTPLRHDVFPCSHPSGAATITGI